MEYYTKTWTFCHKFKCINIKYYSLYQKNNKHLPLTV